MEKNNYEERHAIHCNSGSAEKVRDYLCSHGFAQDIFYFNSSGSLVVKIIESKKMIIKELEEEFGKNINILAQALESD